MYLIKHRVLSESDVSSVGGETSDTQHLQFISVLFFLLTHRSPMPAEELLFDTVVVFLVQHARVRTNSGCLSSVESQNSVVECMRILQKLSQADDIEKASRAVVAAGQKQAKIIAGYDLLTSQKETQTVTRLFRTVRSLGIDITFIDVAYTVETLVEAETDHTHTLTLQGCLAALLLTLGIESNSLGTLFALARLLGGDVEVSS